MTVFLIRRIIGTAKTRTYKYLIGTHCHPNIFGVFFFILSIPVVNRYGRSVNIVGGTFKRAHFHDEWRNWSGVASWDNSGGAVEKKDHRMIAEYGVGGFGRQERDRTIRIEDTILLATIIHIHEDRGEDGYVMDGVGGGPQEGNPINPSVAEPRANPMPHSSARDLRG